MKKERQAKIREIIENNKIDTQDELIKKLKEVGYDGTLTIEREITGEEQKKDIIMAKTLLEKLI